ncbi:MAG: hypothetical protein AVO34_02175 [Firmicutes bacterium ML8_F2]|jgi:GT2 family glycosyltransferase|nr:MAG: hypothetical protein AVO34_02175 [Firmicutes bacterium ML8_F2]
MLSIIITHHRTPILLKLCLRSIRDNLGLVEYEVIIADSQSEPLISNLINEEFPSAKLIPFPKNVGYAKIVNAGIKNSQGEYILILNADVLITENSVQQLIEFMEKNNQAGIVGPQLMTFANQPQHSCFRFPSIGAILARRTFLKRLTWGKRKLNDFLMENGDSMEPKSVDWMQGSSMLIRRQALEKVGLLDERFFMYLEDTDWCRRFWEKGYQIFCLPKAKMFHYYYRISKKFGGSLDVLFNKYTRIHIISAIKYFWKWRKA